MGVSYPELPSIQWPTDRACFLLGLTGGIGSGKSAAARCFAESGAEVADADQIAREVLHSETLREPLRAALGDGIFDESGQVSRPAIAKRVFGHPERLERLNGLIHPAVRQEFQRRQADLEARAGQDAELIPVLVYDIPLLFESGQQDQFDLIVAVTAPVELRYERVERRNGWSRDEFDGREAAQMPLREKAERADFVIENAGSEADLAAAVQALYRRIVAEKREPKMEKTQ
ncbi:MAG: dephospho-CoA kinase [bacterium]|nr:dephospho-CoA kinase [bacterium]